MAHMKGILKHVSLKFGSVGISASKIIKAYVALVQPEVKNALTHLASACVANTGAEPEDLTVQETANCTHAEPPDIAIPAEAISTILSTRDISHLETDYLLEYLQTPRDLVYLNTCKVRSFKKVNSEYYDEKEEKEEDKDNEGEDERSKGEQKEEEQGDLIGRNTPAPLEIQKQDSPQKDSSSQKMHSMYNDVIKNVSGECQLRGPLHEHTLKSALVNQEIEKTTKSLEIPDKPTKDEHGYRNEYCMTSVPPIVSEQRTELQSKIDPCDLLALKKENSPVKLRHPAHRIALTDLRRGFQKSIQSKAGETICLYSSSRDVTSYVIFYDDLFSMMPFKDQIFIEYWRLNSLNLYPQVSTFRLLIPRLAQSGFYYDVALDDILCFSCKVCKRDWANKDNPALVHQNISPYCLHAFFQDERNIPLTLKNYTLLDSSTRPAQRVRRINQTQDNIVPQNRSNNQKVACKIFKRLNYFPDSFSSLSNDKFELSGASGIRGKSTECSASEPRSLPSKALHPTKSQESPCDGNVQGEGDPSSHSEEPCLSRSKLASTSSCLGQKDGTSSSIINEELSTSNLKNTSQSSLRNCKHCSFKQHNLESAESSPIQPSAKNSKKLVPREEPMDNDLGEIFAPGGKPMDNDLGEIFAPGEEPMDNDFREILAPGGKPMDNDLREKFVPGTEPIDNDLREKCVPGTEPIDNDLREKCVPGTEPIDNDLREKCMSGKEPIDNDLREKCVPGTEPIDNDLREKCVPGTEPIDNDLREKCVPGKEPIDNDLREKCVPGTEPIDNDLREKCVPGTEPIDNDLREKCVPGTEPIDNDLREKCVPGTEPIDNDLREKCVPGTEPIDNDLREKCVPGKEPIDNDLREKCMPGTEPIDNDLREKCMPGTEPIDNDLREKCMPGTEPIDNDLRENYFCSNALFADVQSRVTSFTGWPKQSTHDPKLLANADFYYSGNISKVRKLRTARIAPTVGDGKLQDKINKKEHKKEVTTLKSSPSNHTPFMIKSSHHLSKTTILEPIDSRLLTEIYSNDELCENQ